MLTYHPIHDLNHCIFRILCLAYDVKDSRIAVDLIKILDFYILFPHTLANLSMPRQFTSVKKSFKAIKTPYEELPAPAHLMFVLSPIQEQALKSLMGKGILEQNDLSRNYVSMQEKKLSKEILHLIEAGVFRKQEWYKNLVTIIPQINLKGKSGLKYKSGLLEYRYDSI